MTNREWLNSLSDEEFLENVYIFCCTLGIRCEGGIKCKECSMNWLQKEHEEYEQEVAE